MKLEVQRDDALRRAQVRLLGAAQPRHGAVISAPMPPSQHDRRARRAAARGTVRHSATHVSVLKAGGRDADRRRRTPLRAGGLTAKFPAARRSRAAGFGPPFRVRQRLEDRASLGPKRFSKRRDRLYYALPRRKVSRDRQDVPGSFASQVGQPPTRHARESRGAVLTVDISLPEVEELHKLVQNGIEQGLPHLRRDRPGPRGGRAHEGAGRGLLHVPDRPRRRAGGGRAAQAPAARAAGARRGGEEARSSTSPSSPRSTRCGSTCARSARCRC